MVTLSVIVPVHNDGGVVERTLTSVEAAIHLARRRWTPRDAIRAEVVVVDDGSVDGTAQLVDEFIAGRDGFRMVRRSASSSAGTARNAGVAASSGDLLFFLDGDDVFLEDHVLACLEAITDASVDYVKTDVALSDPVHPDWHGRIRNSVVINLCVRRRCHERIGGFPDYHVFSREGDRFVHELDAFRAVEDVYYNRLLHRVARGRTLEVATVKHFRYPGNSFDRQYEKFRRPFGEYREPIPEDRDFQVRLAELLLEHHRRRPVARPHAAGDGRGRERLGRAEGEGATTRPAEPAGIAPPVFTADWFSLQARQWPRYLAPFIGRPGLQFLEIGCFEGRATLWLLHNVLTHPTSRITCIDTFAGSDEHRAMAVDTAGIEARFDHNVAVPGGGEKVIKLRGTSQEVLRGLPLRHYDFAYVDGSHVAADVLEDAVLCRRLLKAGAILIFDDYRWDRLRGDRRHPKVAIDLFLEVFGHGFEVVDSGYQVVLRKLADP